MALVVVVCPMIHAQAQANGDESEEAEETVRLALMRGVPEKWNLEANFATFLSLVKKAARQDVDIFITPEAWLDGYASPDKGSTPDKLRGVAQDLNDSEYLRTVAEQAAKHTMFVCFGFTSLEDGKIYNAAGLWGPDGALIGVYHKTHLQNHDLQYAPGEALPVWPTPWGPVGIMICADRRWPETARTMRLQGARLILNPTYGFHNEFNESMMRTRAYENQCFIAFTHPEEGLVTGPKGQVVAKELGRERAVLICEVDLRDARDDNHLRDRRPELYSTVTEVK
jgi:predicted amidohydrolase